MFSPQKAKQNGHGLDQGVEVPRKAPTEAGPGMDHPHGGQRKRRPQVGLEDMTALDAARLFREDLAFPLSPKKTPSAPASKRLRVKFSSDSPQLIGDSSDALLPAPGGEGRAEDPDFEMLPTQPTTEAHTALPSRALPADQASNFRNMSRSRRKVQGIRLSKQYGSQVNGAGEDLEVVQPAEILSQVWPTDVQPRQDIPRKVDHNGKRKALSRCDSTEARITATQDVLQRQADAIDLTIDLAEACHADELETHEAYISSSAAIAATQMDELQARKEKLEQDIRVGGPCLTCSGFRACWGA